MVATRVEMMAARSVQRTGNMKVESMAASWVVETAGKRGILMAGYLVEEKVAK